MVIEKNIMERTFADIELIDRYQRGTASVDEKREVQNKLLDDGKFRELFDDLEIMSEGIRRSGARSTIEEKLANLDGAIEEEDESNSFDQPEVDTGDAHEESKPKVILWYNQPVFRAIAASVVLLVVVWVAFGPMKKVNNQELVAEYFDPYDNANSPTRGEGVASKDIAAEAFTAYDLGDYRSSIPLFEEALENEDDVLMNTFYIGNAYLATGDGKKAISSFSTMVETGKGLAGVAKWYLALAYLQADSTEKAISTLKDVRENGEVFYAKKAGNLLNALE